MSTRWHLNTRLPKDGKPFLLKLYSGYTTVAVWNEILQEHIYAELVQISSRLTVDEALQRSQFMDQVVRLDEVHKWGR